MVESRLLTVRPDGTVAPEHFNALYSVWKMHASNFMHSFPHAFFYLFLTAW